MMQLKLKKSENGCSDCIFDHNNDCLILDQDCFSCWELSDGEIYPTARNLDYVFVLEEE